jgi:4'-phosphopantetheinyl transferase
LLSADERRRADDFALETPRRRFVIARAALRTVVGRYIDLPRQAVELHVDDHGKPRLAENHNRFNLHFNVAHSGDVALIAATTRCEVGVDVEQLRSVRHAEQIAQRYFHPQEWCSIIAAPPAERDANFLRCWTAKEALFKAVGTGITGSLAEFCVPFDCEVAIEVDVPARSRNERPTRCWLQRLDVGSKYLAAVAVVESARTARICDFVW